MKTSSQEGSNRSKWPPRSAWWLIVKDGNRPLEPLTVGCNGRQTLPLFSFEEEAEMYLQLEGLGSHWRARITGCGELVSVFYGACTSVRRVALDPLPEMVADGTIGLASLDRSRFVDQLLGSGT